MYLHIFGTVKGIIAVGDIVINAHRERIGLLENHAHTSSQLCYLNVLVYVLTVKEKFSRDLAALNKVVHAVDGFEQCGFATARGANECRYFIGCDVKAHIFQGVEIPVIKVAARYAEFIVGRLYNIFIIHKIAPNNFIMLPDGRQIFVRSSLQ